VRVISRSEEEYTRDRKNDLQRVHRNIDPALHPFEKAREYTRALNAVKLDKIFAKPFVAALDGHSDGVYSLCKHPQSLSLIISGSCDGEIRVWHLSSKKTLYSVPAHSGFVRGITVAQNGKSFFSCGDDRTVKQWPVLLDSEEKSNEDIMPIQTFLGEHAFSGIDHHWKLPLFATSGTRIDIWDEHRAEAVQHFSWGCDSINTVKFNPVEADILASCATDRNIALYDLRASTPIRKVVLEMRTNAIAWNPMEAFNFSIANEDHNCYTFDMRRLDSALNVHKDHVSAVLDIDYSPTGAEFVSGSYDRTIRIFPIDQGRSREVYHTKRMQRIFTVRFTADARFVISGSDDTNIRIWKAVAAEPLKTLVPREQQKLDYRARLKERYKHMPEIKRIARHRHVPKAIYNASKLKGVMKKAADRKQKNVSAHSKETAKPKAERRKHIITQEE